MKLMLTLAAAMLVLAFLVGRVLRHQSARVFQTRLTIGLVAVAPLGGVLASMQIVSSQGLAWGLLLLLPATAAWAVGCIVGYSLPTIRAPRSS